jgi:hypothetical protein
MKGPAILLGVVVLLVLLFVVGLGAGAARDGSTQKIDPARLPGLGLLERLTGGKPRLESDDFALAPGAPAGCLLRRPEREVVVPLDTTCRLSIAPAPPGLFTPPAAVRRLALRLTSGATVEVSVQRRGTPPERETLATARTAEVDVFKEGGSVELRCRRGAAAGSPTTPCRLELPH